MVTNGHSKTSAYLPFCALALLALLWGYNWVAMKVGLKYCDPFTFAVLRNVLGAILLFVVLAIRRQSFRIQAFWWTVLIGIFQTSMSGLMYWAISMGSAGKTSVLNYTMPFWLLLIAWPVLGERIRGVQWVAVACAFGGLIFVLDPWRLNNIWAGLLAVGGGICWAVGSVLLKIFRKKHDVNVLSFTAWQALIGSVPLAIVAVFTDKAGPTWTATFDIILAYNVMATVAFILWMYVLHHLPAGTAGIGTLAIPVVGVISAWIQLGERPGAFEAVGMGLIIAALAVLTAREVRAGRQLSPVQPAVALRVRE